MNLLHGEKEKLLFSGRPGGNRNTDSTFNNLGNNGNWWSSTADSTTNAINRQLNYNNAVLNRNSNTKANAFSVRLCKDYDGTDGKPSVLFKEIYNAYMDARRYKRNTINQLKFERNLEAEILKLENELLNFTYEIKPSVCFVNEYPVKREIIAADFRDRVIHHFVYNRIYPYFEKKFIHDSYSCRIGKGTLFGIKRVQKFVKSCMVEPYECWVLRLDVKGFFMAINRDILYKLVAGAKSENKKQMFASQKSIEGSIMPDNLPTDYPAEKIIFNEPLVKEMFASQKYKNDNPMSNDLLTSYLVEKIIFNEPLKNALYKSHPSKWDDLPKDKSLKYSNENCGLPIGNLTSQIFANIYLNPLDHFVKRELKIKRYGRYVDDMVFVHKDKQILINVIPRIREFLADELKLTLHPKKIYLQQAYKGFDFLGARITPYSLRSGKRIEANFRKCLFAGREDQAQTIQSYLGLIKHLC